MACFRPFLEDLVASELSPKTTHFGARENLPTPVFQNCPRQSDLSRDTRARRRMVTMNIYNIDTHAVSSPVAARAGGVD